MKKITMSAIIFIATITYATHGGELRPTNRLKSFDIEYRELLRISKIPNSAERKTQLINFLYNGLSSYGNLLTVISLVEDLDHSQRDAQVIKGLIKNIAKNSGVQSHDIRYEDTLHIDPLMDKNALETVKNWLK